MQATLKASAAEDSDVHVYVNQEFIMKHGQESEALTNEIMSVTFDDDDEDPYNT